MQKNIMLIKEVFENLKYKWVEPYMTTEGAINRQETGMHRGLYYIYPEKNFYFGKAQSTKGAGTIYHRHQTHRPKLDVDLAELYGPQNIKKQPKWTFPKGFREGVVKYLIKENIAIPDNFISFIDNDGIKKCKPANLNFTVTHTKDIETLPVLVWNLDHFSEESIDEIEESVITTIWPYCNNETYRKRRKNEEMKTKFIPNLVI